MQVSIFIKSYRNDFKWLKYCLRSINKFYTGWDEIVIAVPERDRREIESWGLTNERIVVVPEYGEGYLYQQVAKLQAYKYCNGQFIQFVDSDIVFTEPLHVDFFFRDGHPIILKTRYDGKRLGGAECWKDITEKALGYPVEFEYMRRNCLVYHRSTLELISRSYPALEKYVMKQPNRAFSEFNFMGAFVEKFHSAGYKFLDTDKEEIPPQPWTQYWSWGGLNEETINQLEGLLQ